MAEFIPGTPDLTTEVADLLHQANHAIRRQAMADVEPSGVTASQMRALRTLVRRRDAPMRMSELADALGIVRRSATSVVDGLESLGFVERVDDPSDHRAVFVQLTEAGRKTMEEARRRRRTAAGRVLQSLTTRELDTLRGLLQHIVAP
jgi:DNA-binding MarR family transcriptional regulator